jgi:sugar phosphate isomerase/epimerase
MRLGGPVFGRKDSPETWVAAVRAAGYRAAYCPVALDADDDTIRTYAEAARKASIVIAEVGAWSNPLSPDATTADAAIAKCKASMLLSGR